VFYAGDSSYEINDVVKVTVLPLNDPPTDAIITVENRDYYDDTNQPAMGYATDVDIPYGDEITFTWSSNISGLIGTSKEVNLMLPAGLHTVTLKVVDSIGAWCETSFEIDILAIPIDDDDSSDDDNVDDSSDDDIDDSSDDYTDDTSDDGVDDEGTSDIDTGESSNDETDGTGASTDTSETDGNVSHESEGTTAKEGNDSLNMLIFGILTVIIILAILGLIFYLKKREPTQIDTRPPIQTIQPKVNVQPLLQATTPVPQPVIPQPVYQQKEYSQEEEIHVDEAASMFMVQPQISTGSEPIEGQSENEWQHY